MCVATSHRKCEHVEEIADVLSRTDLDQEQEMLMRYIGNQTHYVTDHEAKCALIESRLDIESDRVKEVIAREKEELIAHIDALEMASCGVIDNACREVTDIVEIEKQFATTGREICDKAAKTLERDGRSTNSLAEFVKLHEVKKKLYGHFSQLLRQEITENKKFEFSLNSRLRNMLSVETFGNITIKCQVEPTDGNGQDSCNDSSTVTLSETSQEKPLHYGKSAPAAGVSYHRHSKGSVANIRMPKIQMQFLCSIDPRDGPRDWVSGAAVLDNRIYATCNQSQKALCLLRETKTLFTERRQTSPWNVSVDKDNRLAVTYPQERVIRVYDVHCHLAVLKIFRKPSLISRALELHRTIPTEEPCYGIAVAENRYVVACEDRVKVYDHHGFCLQSLRETQVGGVEPLFRRAFGIAFDAFRHVAYITDEANHSLIALKFQHGKLKDELLFEYKNDALRSPTGTMVTTSGDILVCGFVSKNMHVVSPAGSHVQIVPTSQRPYAVAMDGRHPTVILAFYPESDLDNNAHVLHLYHLHR